MRDTHRSHSAEFPTCSEDEFTGVLAERLGFLTPIPKLLKVCGLWDDRAKRAFSEISNAAGRIGVFLEDADARTNAKYAPLSEFISALQGFAKVGRHLCHLKQRVGAEFPVAGGSEAFFRDVDDALEFVLGAMRRIHGAMREEIVTVLGDEAAGVPEDEENNGATAQRTAVLPHTLEDVTIPEQEQRIATLASKFLAHRRILKRQSDNQKFQDPKKMRDFVLNVSDEQEVRYFETRIHTLLSRYDTYVEGTSLEAEDPDLPAFRGHIVVMVHLLKIMIELVHFYERHENDIRSIDAKDRIAALVDKGEVLDRILNFCLFYLHAYVDAGAPIAEKLVSCYTRQTRITLTVPDGVDIHARPVSLITKVVAHHGTTVNMTVGDTTCYAGSIINVLMTVGNHPSVRQIEFEGDSAPLRDLQTLFEHGLGEGSSGLPESLSYLGLSKG